MMELGAIYRLCVSVCLSVCLSVCTALLKKVVSPSDCKITKLIKLQMLETLPSGTALLSEVNE